VHCGRCEPVRLWSAPTCKGAGEILSVSACKGAESLAQAAASLEMDAPLPLPVSFYLFA